MLDIGLGEKLNEEKIENVSVHGVLMYLKIIWRSVYVYVTN